MPDKTTAKNDAAGNVAFGKIGYTLELLKDVTPAADGSRTKVFEYKVTETGSAAGVTNDKDSSRTFKVTLKDDGSGHLTVTVDPAAGPAFSFTNTYDVDEQPSSITDQIKITKELAGRDMKAGEFSFELLEDGKVVATGKNDGNGNVTFSSITYKKPGTHTYTVREVKGNAGGVTYDETIYTVYTQVTDQGNGKLKVEHQVMETVTGGEMAPANDNAITFSNGYKPDATSVTVSAVKTLTGRDLEADQFTFQLRDAEGNVVATAKNSKSGEVSFGTLHFSKVGVYEYTISEVNDGKGGVTYDEHVHKLTVTVTDDGEGSLKAEVSGGTAIFANSYEASETDPVDITDGFSKVLTGRDWNSKDSFTFTIENTDKPESVENAPMPEKSEITVKKADVKNGKAPISFGNITFTKAGVYKYTVSEKSSDAASITYDTAKRVITVTVTDNGTGKLTAAVTAVEGSRTFTNKYETEELPFDEACGVNVTKVLYGHDMAEGQFQFSIKAADKASADKMGIDADKGMTFGSQKASDSEVATLLSSLGITLKQADIGKTYTYTFAETKGGDKGYVYDENEYKLEITTIDNEDGTLSMKVVMTNTTTGKELFSRTLSKEEPALGEKGIVIPFENRYDGSTDVSGGTKADVKADKTLEGRDLRNGEFQFKLATKPGDGSEGKVLQTVKNDGSGNIAFKALSYRTSDKAAGEDAVILSDAVKDGYAVKSVDDKGRTVYTLSYRVYEDQKDSLPGKVTPVTDSFDFTVTVTDNGDGTLTAVTSYPGDKDKFGFVNQYATDDVDVDVKGSKTLAHGDGLTPDDITGKFSFKLESQTAGAPMPETAEAKNDAAGNVDFGKITFKLSDLEGVKSDADGARSKVFEYKVTETGSAAGVTNDGDSKTFRITLHDDGNGNLTATKEPKEGPAFIFTNTYDVDDLPSSITDQIKIDKDLTGRDMKDGEFSFEMLEDGEVVAAGKNDGNGNVAFSSITYKKPGTHTYTVREVKGSAGGVTYDENVFTVYTQVTDQGNGKLKAEHHVILSAGDGEFAPSDDNKITFSNSYKADPASVTVGALKKLIGRDLKDGEFTFLLKDADGKTVAKAKNDESGAVTFKELVFDKAGEYGYTVSEVNDGQKNMTYDKTVCRLTVKVTDDGEGVLKAELKGDKTVFTNTYKSDKPHKTTDGDKPGKGASTGDDSSMTLALTLMMIAATVGCIVIVRRKISQ